MRQSHNMLKTRYRMILSISHLVPDEYLTEKIKRHAPEDYQFFAVVMHIENYQSSSIDECTKSINEQIRGHLREYGVTKREYYEHTVHTNAILAINNHTVRVFDIDAFTGHKRMIYCKRLVSYPEKYVYIGIYAQQNKQAYYVVCDTEREAFTMINHGNPSDNMIVYKIPLYHRGGSKYLFGSCATIRGESTDRLLYFNIAHNLPKTPIAQYEYMMSLLDYEYIQYDIHGNRIKSYWDAGLSISKGFSDFMRPDYFAEMMNNFVPPSGFPIYWGHEYDEEDFGDTVFSFGNVLNGDNITHMRSETNNV